MADAKRYELFDHTADIGIEAYGRDLKEAFANMAYGMFSVIAELDKVGETESRDIALEAEDREALLVAWLNELLYLFDVEHIIFKRFEISLVEGKSFGELRASPSASSGQGPGARLRARAYGETFDPKRHVLNTGIKAATYHTLKVEQENGARLRVIFDV